MPAWYRLPIHYRWLLPIVMLLVFGTAIARDSLAKKGDRNDSTSDRVRFHEGSLTVSVENASREDLLHQIGDEVGFIVIAVGELSPDMHSWSFVDLPLEKALKRLLVDTNAIVTRASDTSSTQPVSAVYLLGSGSGITRPLEIVPVGPEPDEQWWQDETISGSALKPIQATLSQDYYPDLNEERRWHEAIPQTALEPIQATLQQGPVDHEAMTKLANTLHFDRSLEARRQALDELLGIDGATLRAALEPALADTDARIRMQVEHILENMHE